MEPRVFPRGDFSFRMRYVFAATGFVDHEALFPLFPFISMNGRVGYWSTAMWAKLKAHVELAVGFRFRWKDFRPTYAQRLKDLGAPIEAVSKCLRHKDTGTTEEYYARIRSETAFSQVRRVWETPVAEFQSGEIEN